MPTPLPWFRLWNEIKWDRKIRRLEPADRWLYIVCLSLASESPERGLLLLNSSGVPEVLTHADIADSAAMTADAVGDGLIELCAAGLLEPRDDHEYTLPVADTPSGTPTLYMVPKWGERQPTSDSSTERVRQLRARRRDAQNSPPASNEDETLHARSGNGGVTPPENREQRTEKNNPSVSSSEDTPAPDGHLERFTDHFWPAYPARNGKKREKGKALQKWRQLTVDQQRRAVVGARHYSNAGEGPMDAHRFLTRNTAGEWRFDDWQTPAVANSRQPARDYGGGTPG